MNKDKQLVRITMFVLLVGIVLVYAVFFNIQGESLSVEASNTLQKLIANTQNNDEDKTEKSGDVAQVTGMQNGETSTAGETTGTTVVFSGLSELFGDDSDVVGEIKSLSGTAIFQGNIDVLKTLGINYEYVLKDGTYNIYYVYIGRNKTYDLRSIAQEFGGKTVEILSQKDIINNLYFGDRVTFVELPQYKDVKVNVFIQMGNDLWMIQDDASQYRAHKKYIRQLFTGK